LFWEDGILNYMVRVRFNEISPANSSDCCFYYTLQRHNRTSPGRPVKHIDNKSFAQSYLP